MKKIFFIILSLIVMAACNNSASKAKKNFQRKRETVFAQHDSVMNKMGKMNQLIMKLKPKIDSTTKGKAYKNASQRLKHANQAMMDWMHELHDDFPNINNDKKKFSTKEYRSRTNKLNNSQKQLMQVKHNVNSSISKAESLLGQKP